MFRGRNDVHLVCNNLPGIVVESMDFRGKRPAHRIGQKIMISGVPTSTTSADKGAPSRA